MRARGDRIKSSEIAPRGGRVFPMQGGYAGRIREQS
jgi:hypothetical protein